jgi:hypothetical protein
MVDTLKVWGLYEMVLRRCHYIVLRDGSRDSDCSFEGLGGAVRKIRVDLGIPIEFDGINIFRVRLRPKTNASLKSWACPSRRKKAATARSAEFAIRSLKLCTVWHVQGKIDCGGDFRCLINSILEHHLETEPQYWLASLLEPTPNFSGSFSTV